MTTPATVLDNLVADAGAVCRTVAPELRGLPLYIVPVSELPPDYQVGGCAGVSGPVYDLMLRPVIGDRWAGRGPTMVFDDTHAASLDYAAAKVWLRSVAVHELSHLIGWGWPAPPEAPDLSREGWKGVAVYESCRLAEAVAPETSDSRPAWTGHGWRFFRRLVHLIRRAERRGFGLADWRAILGPVVGDGVSRFGLYEAALDRELDKYAAATFAAIDAAPPPLRFAALWCDDFGIFPDDDAIDALIAGASRTD